MHNRWVKSLLTDAPEDFTEPSRSLGPLLRLGPSLRLRGRPGARGGDGPPLSRREFLYYLIQLSTGWELWPREWAAPQGEAIFFTGIWRSRSCASGDAGRLDRRAADLAVP